MASDLGGDGAADGGRSPGRRVGASLGVLVGAVGFAASLTCVYRGMRDVMINSGAACASGGPYVIANECTGGQISLLFGGIVAMLVFGGLYAGISSMAGASGMAAGFMMWAALFGALGWNFLDLGLDPPPDMTGAAGWIVSGAVFWLMSLGGLWPLAGMTKAWLKRGGAPEEPSFKGPLVRAKVLDPLRTGAGVPGITGIAGPIESSGSQAATESSTDEPFIDPVTGEEVTDGD